MTGALLLLDNISIPQVLISEKDFLIVFKPPGMHSAPLGNSSGGTLLEWCGREFPETTKPGGRKKGEGGLLHRLDYETQGLMIVARTETGMENLLAQQKEEKIIKEYGVLAMRAEKSLPGFPPGHFECPPEHFSINSAFRPYGAGRKAVRPQPEGKKEYVTKIIEKKEMPGDVIFFGVRITSGFRHQIRCHFAWMGFPVINDKLYGGAVYGNGMLGLRANSISFLDPSSGEKRKYSIPSFDNSFSYFGGEVK